MAMNKKAPEKDNMYRKEEIETGTEEYELILDFLDKTVSSYIKARTKFVRIAGPQTATKIFKISENSVATKALRDSGLKLFHGTKERAVEGILSSGFKNSQRGTFGQGVYLTDCSSIAYAYALGKEQPASSDWKNIFTFYS